MRGFASIFLVAALLVAPAALADVAAPPPEDCPAGGVPSTDHYGGYCSAWACTSDADCWSGQLCRPASLCVHDRLFEHPRGNTSRAEVVGLCAARKSCAEGSNCRTGRFCSTPGAKLGAQAATKSGVNGTPEPGGEVPPAPAPEEADELSRPGRCALVGSPGGGLLALGLALVGIRRRPAATSRTGAPSS
jgi:hypothetical protein